MFTSFLIAIGLNFDTFSVSVVEGANTKKTSLLDSLKVAFFFGTVQALLSLLGALIGSGFRLVISNIDHWIAFVLLSIVGYRLIKDSCDKIEPQGEEKTLNYKMIFLLSLATSIDALIVGITLAFIKSQIFIDVLIIGMTTFVVSFIGFHLGRDLKKICKDKSKIIGGIILISIGIKILVEHLFFG